MPAGVMQETAKATRLAAIFIGYRASGV